MTYSFLSKSMISGLVAVALGCLAEPVRADVTVTVLPQQILQRIDGFGASDAWYAWEIHQFSPAGQNRIISDLFSPVTGAGLTLLRHRIPVEIEPSKGVWDWTQDTDTTWLAKQAAVFGVSQQWGTAWSPPAWMKVNNDVNNGGALAPNHYQDYATFLATYIQHFASNGINISAVSIANEPDIVAPYESSNWTGQQFHDFISSYLKPTFQAANITTQVMLPECSGWSDSLAQATLADATTAGFVGIIGTHNYWGAPSPFSDAQAAGKTVWETEVSNLGGDDPSINDGLYWAQVIHHSLVDGQANAWHYWWVYADVSDTTGQSLISGSPWSKTIIEKKRLWTIGNFSRFVRPGAHMVGVSSNTPQSGVLVSAFLNTTGFLTIVAVNSNSSAVNFTASTGSPKLTSVYEYRTSASENLSLVKSFPISGSLLQATLAPISVTTFSLQPRIAIRVP